MVVAGMWVEGTGERWCKCSSLVVSRLLSLVISVQLVVASCHVSMCLSLVVSVQLLHRSSISDGFLCLLAILLLKYQRCRRSCPCFSDFVANCILLLEKDDWLAVRFRRIDFVLQERVTVSSYAF